MLTGLVSFQRMHPPLQAEQAEQRKLTRRAHRLLLPLDQFILGDTHPPDWTGPVTLDYDTEGQIHLTARTHEPEILNVHRAMTTLHAIHPGLPAWVLQEAHAAFRLTHLMTTPQWAASLITELLNQTPLERRTTYRQREAAQHARARLRHTERAIAKEGYLTSYSPLLHWGHWLCTPQRPVGNPQSYGLLESAGDRWFNLACVLREARASALPPQVQAHRAPYPALILGFLPEHHEDDAGGLTGELLEHLGHVWRSHDGSFAWLNTSSPKVARQYRRTMTLHQDLAQELCGLLSPTHG